MSDTLIFEIKPLDENIRELYNPHLTFEDNSSKLDLFTPENILIKAHSTQMINFNINVNAYANGSLNNNNRVAFYMFPKINIIKTPLRLSCSPIIIEKYCDNVIHCFVDNISDTEYLLKKGSIIVKLCGILMQKVNIVVKQESFNA